MHKIFIALAAASCFATAACNVEDDSTDAVDHEGVAGDVADDADEDLGEAQALLYTAWQSSGDGSSWFFARACQTSTRVYWEFINANGSYTSAATWGTGIAPMNSAIGGVASGTKYRTKNGPLSYFSVQISRGGSTWGPMPFYTIPAC